MYESPRIPHIKVQGHARRELPPEIARLKVNLFSVDLDLSHAKSNVDQRSGRVLDLAKSLRIATADITATNMTIAPEYDWSSDKVRTFRGTNVSRDVDLVLRDLSRFGELLQGFADVPISALKQLNMDITDRTSIEAELLKEAIEDARQQARVVAGELNVALGTAFSVDAIQHLRFGGCASHDVDRGNGTFEPGVIELSREVNAIFRIVDSQ